LESIDIFLEAAALRSFSVARHRVLGAAQAATTGMSVSRPSQCLLCIFKRSQRLPNPRIHRSFATTRTQRKDESSDGDEQKISDVTITEQGIKSQKTQSEVWSQQYNPRQQEAIKAAQEIIGDKFEEGKNVGRTDPWSVDYYDDFEMINPVADIPVRAPWKNLDDDARLRTTEEAMSEFLEFEQSLPEKSKPGEESNGMKVLKKFDEMRLLTGRLENELDPPSAMMPTAPAPRRVVTPKSQSSAKTDGETERQPKGVARSFTPEMVRLMQMTGLNAEALGKLRVKTIVSDRVSNQTRLGKIHKMKFISIAGNGDGLLGIGEGKSDEPSNARLQSQYRAIRSMQPIKRYEKRTIFGTVNAKVSATELELYDRPPGMYLPVNRVSKS
jgi:small subunit ribosomal protein S5